MMKEKQSFKQNYFGKKGFKYIKEAIAHAPNLVHPKINKKFIIYLYAFEHTMSKILLQANEQKI